MQLATFAVRRGIASAAASRAAILSPVPPAILYASRRSIKSKASGGSTKEPRSSAPKPAAESVDASSIPQGPLDGPLDPTMPDIRDPSPAKPSATSNLAESYLNRTEVMDDGGSSSTERALLRQTEGASPGEPHRARIPKARRQTAAERRRDQYVKYAFYGVGLGTFGFLWYLGRDYESEIEQRKLGDTSDTPGLMGTPRRAWLRFFDKLDTWNKPLWEPLLPPPSPPPHQKPYTLLIDLEDLLVRTEWNAGQGYRVALRPGMQYFLSYLSEFYEIVVFTTQQAFTGQQLLDKIDPLQLYIVYRLYRECTRTYKGQPVKDLNYLGRDLSKTIIIDTDPDKVQLQPDNAVLLPAWDGSKSDRTLVDIIPFLEAVALLNVPDTRAAIKKYGSTETAQHFAEEQARLRADHIAQWEAKGGKISSSGGSSWSLGSLLGLSAPSASSPRGGPPPMFLDILRERAQKAYADYQKYINEHKDAMMAQMKADQERALKETKNSLLGFMSGDLGGRPAEPTK